MITLAQGNLEIKLRRVCTLYHFPHEEWGEENVILSKILRFKLISSFQAFNF